MEINGGRLLVWCATVLLLLGTLFAKADAADSGSKLATHLIVFTEFPGDMVVKLGHPFTLVCKAKVLDSTVPDERLTYTWSKDGRVLTHENRWHVHSAKQNDSGSYTCSAENLLLRASSSPFILRAEEDDTVEPTPSPAVGPSSSPPNTVVIVTSTAGSIVFVLLLTLALLVLVCLVRKSRRDNYHRSTNTSRSGKRNASGSLAEDDRESLIRDVHESEDPRSSMKEEDIERYGYSTPPERKQKKLMKSQSTPVTSSFEDLLKSESQESPFLGKSDLTETLEDDDLQLDESMFEQHPTIPSVVEKTKSEACLPEVLNSHNQLHKTKPVEDLSKRHRHASDPYKNGSAMLDTSTNGKSEGGSSNKKDYQSMTEISHSTSKGGTVGVGGVISSRRSSETSDIQSDLSDAASLDHSFRRDRFFYDDSGVSTAVEGPSRASQGEEEGKGERGGDGLAGSEGVRRHSHSEVDPKRKGGKLAKDVISPEIIKSKSDSDFRSSNKMPPHDNIGIFESSLMSSDSKVEQTRLRDESSHKTAATKPIDSQVDREGIDSPPTLTQTESSSGPGEKRLYSDESTRSEAEKMSADSPHEEKSNSVTVAKIREMFQKKEPQGVQFPTLLAKSELQKQKLQSKLVTERTIQLLQRHKAVPQPKIAHPLEQSKQSPSLKRQASSSSPSARENSPLLTQRSNMASRSPVIDHVHGGPNEEKPTQARSNTPLEESENTSSDNNNDDDDIDEPLDLETHDKESASSEETPTSVSSSSTSLTHAHAHAHAQAEKAVPPPPPPSSIPLFFTPLTGIQFRRQRAELLRSSISSSNNNDNNKNKNKNNHRDNNSKSTQLDTDKSIYPVWDESPPSSEESEEEEEEEGDELVQPLQSHTGLPPGSHDDGGRQRLPRYGSGSSATTSYASHTAGTRGTEANSNNKSKPQLSPQLMSHISRNRQVKHSTLPRADLPQALATSSPSSSSSVMAAKRHPPQPPFRRQQQQNRRNLSAIPEEPPSP